MLNKKTLKEVVVKDQRVLVRADFNVPLADGRVRDDNRLIAALPTLRYLLKSGAGVAVCAHLGRPGGKVVEKFRLNPVADRLSELLDFPVRKLDNCAGPEAEAAKAGLKPGELILLENTRFHPGETDNDPMFARRLAEGVDLFVNDAFGTAHRAHASTAGVANYLPSVAGLLMERENIARALGRAVSGYHRAASPSGTTLPILFADSLVFQKFQRAIHRAAPCAELEDFLVRMDAVHGPTALYASDAEVFDFRPRRYDYEAQDARGEWDRIATLLRQLAAERPFLRPSEALAATRKGRAENIITRDAHYPIPVKKQLKYNLARWAVSGRDDLWLGTRGHALARTLDSDDPEQSRFLLGCWSSDLRTHIVPERLATAFRAIEEQTRSADNAPAPWRAEERPEGVRVTEKSRFELEIETERMRLVLNPRRGLKIKSLAFASHGFEATVGTLPHGYFQAIDLGADFYSGGLVIESPVLATRITDLEQSPYQIGCRDGWLELRIRLETSLGRLIETIALHPEREQVTLGYQFPDWQRPAGIVRVGNITLLPEAFVQEKLTLSCANGGPVVEQFSLTEPCRHQAAVSSLVSCTTGFGATTGEIVLGDRARQISLSWDPAACAAFPMLWHEPSPPSHLTRVIFSLAELDDTRREGGRICEFALTLTPGTGTTEVAPR